MFTINDYLKFYKDKPLNEIGWNQIDNLLCSILVYIPIPNFKKEMNLNELYDAVLLKKETSKSFISPKAIELLKSIKPSKRYKNLTISNFVNNVNGNTQFGACIIKVEEEKIVVFKGTDFSMIGWLENFRLLYQYPTYTQQLAIDYLKENINEKDKDIYVVGHSKGGNLAMVSTMELDDAKFSKIKRVYNFDGPGFKKEEYEGEKYKRLKSKLSNIIPSSSAVGTILYNDTFTVVSSNEKAINQHYPTNWNVFGQFFVPGKLSKISTQFHINTSDGLNGLDRKRLKETVEACFESFGRDYSKDFKLKFEDIKKFYTNMKNIDPKVRDFLDIIIDELMKDFFSISNIIKDKEK